MNFRVAKSVKSIALGGAAAFVLSSVSVQAQDAGNVKFDIPAQDLASALTEFGIQSGTEILFVASDLSGKTSNGIEGSLTAQSAINELLGGSGIEYRVNEDGTLLVGQAYVQASPNSSAGQITVTETDAAETSSSSNGDADTPTTVETDDDASEEEASYDQPLVAQRVVITGTRIEGAPPASPIVSLDRREIDARGLTSVEDIVRFLPQNFAGTNTGGQLDGNFQNRFLGASTINLRGLGEGSTLVLVNGKRIAASPAETGTFTDISNIPFGAIERVEVLTDGASAIYGSDAVGGVVNFILKKDYAGIEARARYENSSSGGDRYRAEFTGGKGWGSGNLTGSITYTKDEAVDYFDAGFVLERDFRDQGGRYVADLAGFLPNAGQPAVLRGAPFLPGTPPPGSLFGILPAGDGTNIDFSQMQYVAAADFFSQSGTYFDLPTVLPNTPLDLTPESEQISAYISFQQELTDSLELDVSALVSKRESRSTGLSFFLANVNVPETNFYRQNNGLTVANGFSSIRPNPFEDPTVPGDEFLIVPAPLLASYAFYNETEAGLIPRPITGSDAQRYNIDATLKWQMPVKDWVGSISLTTGEDDVDGLSSGIDVANPDYLVALSSADPGLALNLFGDGTLQSSLLPSLIATSRSGSRIGKQEVYALNLTGSLFELPAGNVKFSAGAELREDETNFTSSTVRLFGAFNTSLFDFVPTVENTAYFAEVFVPVIGRDSDVPFVHEFSFSAAGRYDEYDIEGPFEGVNQPFSSRTFDAFVPKFGAVWYPVKDLKLRATWGEAFQAPTVFELFDPPTDPRPGPFLFDPRNPASNGGPGFVPVRDSLGGNANLQPQTSETTTFGFDLSPQALSALTVSATWSKTEFNERIGNLFSVYNFTDPFPLENSELFPDLVIRDANGVLTDFYAFRPLNLSSRINESIDFTIRYGLQTENGDFTFGLSGVHTLKQEDIVGPGTDPIDLTGTSDGPLKWAGNAFIDWTKDNWSAGATINYSDNYELRDTRAIRTEVDSYTTVDLRAGYEMPDSGWRFSAGVNNVFDEDFPFVDNGFGADSRIVDFRRRVFFIDVTKEFSF